MGTPTRRAVLKGTAALAGLAAVQASGLAPAAAGAPARTGTGGAQGQVGLGHGGPGSGPRAGPARARTKANVLLGHGAWVDGSSWSQVIAILQRRGYNVVAVQLPMTSLAADVAWTPHGLAERLAGAPPRARP